MFKKTIFTKNEKLKWVLLFIIITILSIFLRYYLFEIRNSWHDEWHSIYVADPNIPNSETLKRFWGDKGDNTLTEYYPPLYLFLLKFFFKIFGYIDDNGRIFSLIFGILVVPLSMKLASYLEKSKKYVFYVGIFTSLNLFLIWQSLEVRAHMLVVFVSVLNLILFFEILKSNTKIKTILYYSVSVFNLSLWPITGLIFVGKVIYLVKEMIYSKKIFYKKFLIFFLILLTYIFLNIDYLKYNLARDFHYTGFSETFFYNYHFRSFFGSIFNGGIFLLIFGILIIKNFIKIFIENNKENIFVYIIGSTYLITIFYSFYKASIMSPKYVIFLVPYIIIWISFSLSKLKFSNIFLIILTIFCFANLINLNNYPMSRPETKLALKSLANIKSTNIIFSTESDVFNNYLKTKKLFKKNNFKIVELEDLKNDQKFWFFCLNNPRFAVGEGNFKTDERCKIIDNNNNYNLINTMEFPDILIKEFIKIN